MSYITNYGNLIRWEILGPNWLWQSVRKVCLINKVMEKMLGLWLLVIRGHASLSASFPKPSKGSLSNISHGAICFHTVYREESYHRLRGCCVSGMLRSADPSSMNNVERRRDARKPATHKTRSHKWRKNKWKAGEQITAQMARRWLMSPSHIYNQRPFYCCCFHSELICCFEGKKKSIAISQSFRRSI